MIREIQRLQRKNDHLEEEKDTLGEKNAWVEQIMRSLKDDGQGTEIISRLKRGDTHQAIAEWLGQSSIGLESDPKLSATTERSVRQAIEQYHLNLEGNQQHRYWTKVTQDAQLIEHLFTLYFTWINPMHMILDEMRFMTSFRECSQVHCSFALVNVICALSCHLLHNIDTGDQTKVAVDSLHNRFMEETRELMNDADLGKTTTVQTHAIMFLAEFGAGHGLLATSYLRWGMEILIEKHIFEQGGELEQVAIWGILTLHT